MRYAIASFLFAVIGISIQGAFVWSTARKLREIRRVTATNMSICNMTGHHLNRVLEVHEQMRQEIETYGVTVMAHAPIIPCMN